MSGVPGPVPLAEINAFFVIHGIDDAHERRRLIDVVRVLDSVYIDYISSKMTK